MEPRSAENTTKAFPSTALIVHDAFIPAWQRCFLVKKNFKVF